MNKFKIILIRYFILVGLFLLSLNQITLQGQNLVGNGSFEILGEYNIPIKWKILSPTVDVIESGKRVFEDQLAKEYDELYSSYLPKSGSNGKNYICLFKLGKGSEAIGIKLNKDLEEGKDYILKMDVFKPEIPGKFPAFEMGVVLSDTIPKSCNGQQCLKQIEGELHILNSQKAPILYENSWITISNRFKATGAERYLILSHHVGANKLISDNHILAYLYDNIILEEASEKAIKIYFEKGSSIITDKEKDKLIDSSLNGVETFKVVGYASEEGESKKNKLLAEQRCDESIALLRSLFPDAQIEKQVVGETKTDTIDNARKVEIIVPQIKSDKQRSSFIQQDLLDLINSLDKLCRQDQYAIERRLKNEITESTLQKIQLKNQYKIDSILSLNYLHSFKLDYRSETNLTVLFLHTSDSIQNKFHESFKHAFEEGFYSSENWAYIYDRHAMINDKPQLYGTQFVILKGKKTLYKTLDFSKLNNRRYNMGLEPIETYLKSVGLNVKEELLRIKNEN